MVILNSPTSVTLHDVLHDVLLHVGPLIQVAQISWGMHVVVLNSPTSVALRDVLGDILLHVRPQVQVAQIMVHLVTARMDRQLGMMSFIQNLPSNLLI